jgi:hypothetical protein
MTVANENIGEEGSWKKVQLLMTVADENIGEEGS